MSRQSVFIKTITLVFLVLVQDIAVAQEGVWAPPPPSNQDRDWIRLSSGEWLWGTIDLMRDESLSFDSEELDDLTIDWEDIMEIRSSRVMTYAMVDGTLFIGTAALKDGILRIETADGIHQLTHAQVYSILDGKPTELNFWSIKLGADWKIYSGNTTQSDFGSRVFLKREAIRSRIDLRYQGSISTVDEIETINNHRGNAEWKIFLSRRFFLTPVKLELYSDKFKNIDLRTTGSVGAGYFLSRSSKADWYVEAGVGYENSKYLSVLDGEEDSEGNGSVPLRTTLEMDLTDNIELTAEYGIQIGIGDDANSVQRTFILFEFDLIGDVDFNASLTWDHMSRPKENAQGVTPKKDDVAMAYGLSINF